MAVTRERVAEQLLALRRLHGTPDKLLSQEKAAQRANVSTRDWGRWENRKVTPRAHSLGLIADAFDIPLDVFDDGNTDRSQTPLADRLDQLDGRLDRIERMLQRLGAAQGISQPITEPGEGPLLSDAEDEQPSPKADAPTGSQSQSGQRQSS